MENLAYAYIIQRFEKLFATADLDDRSWLIGLAEHDEVPLYSRSRDVDFLLKVPASLRGALLLRSAISQLDRVASVIDALDGSAEYFLCLTFTDWDSYQEGELIVPTPSLFVSPDWQLELARSRWIRPQSHEAKLVNDWGRELNREDICVADGQPVRPAHELLRVYVGYVQQSHSFRSVGDF